MPLRTFECSECGLEFKTKSPKPEHCGLPALEAFTIPQVSFLEKVDSDKNKSRMVNQEKILRERARKHSRDVEMDDLILNNEKEIAIQNRWLKTDGSRRKRIDDV